jgi:hypothetical protein
MEIEVFAKPKMCHMNSALIYCYSVYIKSKFSTHTKKIWLEGILVGWNKIPVKLTSTRTNNDQTKSHQFCLSVFVFLYQLKRVCHTKAGYRDALESYDMFTNPRVWIVSIDIG